MTIFQILYCHLNDEGPKCEIAKSHSNNVAQGKNDGRVSGMARLHSTEEN